MKFIKICIQTKRVSMGMRYPRYHICERKNVMLSCTAPVKALGISKEIMLPIPATIAIFIEYLIIVPNILIVHFCDNTYRD